MCKEGAHRQLNVDVMLQEVAAGLANVVCCWSFNKLLSGLMA